MDTILIWVALGVLAVLAYGFFKPRGKGKSTGRPGSGGSWGGGGDETTVETPTTAKLKSDE